MGIEPIRLKVLLQQKHWQTYGTFIREYDRAARGVDPSLVGTYPSRAQLHRWLSGELKGLPYPHHCQVLEQMFTEWSAAQLFEPGSVSGSPSVQAQPPPDVIDGRFADLDAVFPSRSEFAAKLPPHALFDGAKEIRLAGLSLNLLCQQYPADRLCKLIEAGSTVTCLFLDPHGEAIKAREVEEADHPGHLSSLTEMNMQVLTHRVRQRLSESARDRLIIGKYDQTIRFNITIIDNSLAVVQPYMHGIRGLEAPTFMLRNDGSSAGLFPAFEQMFTWIWDRSTLV